MKIPRILLTGTTSGVGKTSITCAIIYALQKKGFSIQPFKVGPDYIDPSYLSSISKNGAFNLDVWLMGEEKVIETFTSNSKSDISVVEGVMGYYDGARGDSNYATTHHVASLIKAPVILILDASKTARSIAATLTGFIKFHNKSRIYGIILNKINSKKHEILCRQALEQIKIPVVGVIYKNKELIFENRHLGLIPFNELKIKSKIKKTARIISESIDIEKIIDIMSNPIPLAEKPKLPVKSPKVSLAIALDNSFNFYYRENLEALRREGANLEFFSPIRDKKLPEVSGIYIGGGFPEVLGSLLEKNRGMKKTIKDHAEKNLPIYAECGGLMYLTKSIDHGSKKFKMIGLYDAETKMTSKMKLNYTSGKMTSRNILSEKLQNFRGHEFHYSELDNVSNDSKFAYNLDIGEGIKNRRDGLIQYNTLASYGHLYFSSSSYAKDFLKNCILYSKR